MSYLSKIKALVLALSFFQVISASAATIDEFKVQASLSSPETVMTSVSMHTAHSKAIGGGRTLTAMKTSTGTGVGVTRIETTNLGGILGVTQGDHGGFASMVWDGDNDTTSIKANGLGSLDLTQDDANAFILQLKSFDFAYGEVMVVSLRIYDPAFSLGNKFS